MTEDLEKIGLAAVDHFISTWNSRDPEAWAGSLHFPHIRPSPFGPIEVAETAADYIARVDFQATIDSGWDHSEWDYKHVLQASAEKIHVAGQWSRYNAAGEIILTTPIVYVVTRVAGTWGIQSRFGADYAGDEADTTELMTRGLNLIQDYVNQHNAGSAAAAAEMLNYPHIAVDAGNLDITTSAADYQAGAYQLKLDSLQAVQTGLHSMNAAVDLQVLAGGETTAMQGVINITNRDGHLGIQAWSLLNPEPIEA